MTHIPVPASSRRVSLTQLARNLTMISASQPSDCLHLQKDDVTADTLIVEFTSGPVSKSQTTLYNECKEAVHHLLSTYSPVFTHIISSKFKLEIEEDIHVDGKTYTVISNSDLNAILLLRYVQIC